MTKQNISRRRLFERNYFFSSIFFSLPQFFSDLVQHSRSRLHFGVKRLSDESVCRLFGSFTLNFEKKIIPSLVMFDQALKLPWWVSRVKWSIQYRLCFVIERCSCSSWGVSRLIWRSESEYNRATYIFVKKWIQYNSMTLTLALRCH